MAHACWNFKAPELVLRAAVGQHCFVLFSFFLLCTLWDIMSSLEGRLSAAWCCSQSFKGCSRRWVAKVRWGQLFAFQSRYLVGFFFCSTLHGRSPNQLGTRRVSEVIISRTNGVTALHWFLLLWTLPQLPRGESTHALAWYWMTSQCHSYTIWDLCRSSHTSFASNEFCFYRNNTLMRFWWSKSCSYKSERFSNSCCLWSHQVKSIRTWDAVTLRLLFEKCDGFLILLSHFSSLSLCPLFFSNPAIITELMNAFKVSWIFRSWRGSVRGDPCVAALPQLWRQAFTPALHFQHSLKKEGRRPENHQKPLIWEWEFNIGMQRRRKTNTHTHTQPAGRSQ